MDKKEVKIEIPEGYEIDKENSTFEKIVFKPIVKRWRDDKENIIKGYYIDSLSNVKLITNSVCFHNVSENHNIFATKKHAKSALAMAQISQIMANDERFGGVITDEEWKRGGKEKMVISRNDNSIQTGWTIGGYEFLAFHTEEQRDLFLKENEDLVIDYLMID